VCARGSNRAASAGPSTSPLGATVVTRFTALLAFLAISVVGAAQEHSVWLPRWHLPEGNFRLLAVCTSNSAEACPHQKPIRVVGSARDDEFQAIYLAMGAQAGHITHIESDGAIAYVYSDCRSPHAYCEERFFIYEHGSWTLHQTMPLPVP